MMEAGWSNSTEDRTFDLITIYPGVMNCDELDRIRFAKPARSHSRAQKQEVTSE